MPRRDYDPLSIIPPPEIIRGHLDRTLALAERLRILLDLAERLRLPLTTADQLPEPNDRSGAKGSGRADGRQ